MVLHVLERLDKELKLVKPVKLKSNRAAALANVATEELEKVMTKHGLIDKPGRDRSAGRAPATTSGFAQGD